LRADRELTPDSLKLTVYPATMSEPVRALELVFGAARYVAVPLPDPVAPEVTVSHEALVLAVHWQPGDAATRTDPTNPCLDEDIGPRPI
jgi:hypothetical protein